MGKYSPPKRNAQPSALPWEFPHKTSQAFVGPGVPQEAIRKNWHKSTISRTLHWRIIQKRDGDAFFLSVRSTKIKGDVYIFF